MRRLRRIENEQIGRSCRYRFRYRYRKPFVASFVETWVVLYWVIHHEGHEEHEAWVSLYCGFLTTESTQPKAESGVIATEMERSGMVKYTELYCGF